MKTLLTTLAFATAFFVTSCKDEVAGNKFDYHAHIYAPDNSVRHMDETLPIDIEFESHTGEEVHHINVRIYNATTLAEVYNQPVDSHIDVEEGYEFMDQVVLSSANGFSPGDWVIQAKVWGETDGEEEEVETVNFQIAN